MDSQQRCRSRWQVLAGRAGTTAFLAWLVWSGGQELRAQPATYYSKSGKSAISGSYDPRNPVPRAPTVVLSTETQPMQPTIPYEQYLAKKAALALQSQPSFSQPPSVQTSGPGPRAPSPAPKAPIASVATQSWQGIQIPATSQAQPPSPDIAVGPSDVVMVINSSIAQFTKTGTLKSQVTFQTWFGSVLPTVCPSGSCLLFDPVVRYDQLHGRFIFLATSRSNDYRFSYLLLSVSKGATFDSGWTIWALDAGLDGTVETGFWGDFWRLGFDNVGVYLSGNMYNAAGLFQNAKIRVLKKSELYNPATTTLNWKDFSNLTNEDGTPADSLTPVHVRGKPAAGNAALLVNSTTFNVPATFLSVWKINDPLADTLTVTRSTINGLWAYNFPAPAPQAFSGTTLDSGDSRMLKAVYRNGFLYTARDTGYTDQVTTVTYDLVDTSTMTLASQARLINTNSFYPSFDVPASTEPGTAFATTNVITGTTTAADGSQTYASISKLKAGEGSFNLGPSPNRWGDYFGGAVDPVSGGLWVSGQYAKTLAQGFGQWGTWVGYFPWSTTGVFNDVAADSPYADYINVLRLWQITTGCSATGYCPTTQVTRAQVATFIIRCVLGDNFTFPTTPYFTDVPSTSPYFPYIQKMRELGITRGCGASTFCPDSSVSRGDAAVLIVRGKMAGLFGDQFSYPATVTFTDVPSNDLRFPFIQKMAELGITTGCTPTAFCPNQLLTRQEMAVFMTRAFLN